MAKWKVEVVIDVDDEDDFLESAKERCLAQDGDVDMIEDCGDALVEFVDLVDAEGFSKSYGFTVISIGSSKMCDDEGCTRKEHK